MKLAVKIDTDLTATPIDISGDTLTALQKAVGGYVECVQLNGVAMWVNEEGKLHNLDYNPAGTVLMRSYHRTDDVIVGDLVITGGTDDEGDLLSLSDAFAQELIAWVSDKNGLDHYPNVIKMIGGKV